MGAKNSSSCKSFDFLDGGLVVEESLLLELLSRGASTYLWRKTSFCRSFCYHCIGTKQYLCKSPFAAEIFHRWEVDNREAQHQLTTYVQNIDHDPVFRDLGPKFVETGWNFHFQRRKSLRIRDSGAVGIFKSASGIKIGISSFQISRILGSS